MSSTKHHDEEIESWLREEVVPYTLELERDPSQLLTIEQVDVAISEERKRFIAEFT